MKIFSWVQSKLTSKKSNPNIPDNHRNQQACKEEFSDWPHGLLAIGTFGNKIKQEAENANLQETFPFPQDLNLHGLNLTAEEVGKLQKELNLIFDEHVGRPTSANMEAPNLPFDKLLDTNSSTDAAERDCSSCPDGSNNKNDYHPLQFCSTSLVHCSEKDISLDNSKAAIGKKSFSFLLKKMFVCTSGFSPAPSLRDPIMELRIEKMLKTLLRNKIYPQSCCPKLSTKKSLESSHFAKNDNADEKVEKVDDGSKWVKTDSEYIVLEI